MADTNSSGMGIIVGIVAIIAILAISYFVFERMQEVPKEEDSPGIILQLNGGSGNQSSAN